MYSIYLGYKTGIYPSKPKFYVHFGTVLEEKQKPPLSIIDTADSLYNDASSV